MQNNSGRSIWGLVSFCLAVGMVACMLVLAGCTDDDTSPIRIAATSTPRATPQPIMKTAIAGGDSWNVVAASTVTLANAVRCDQDRPLRNIYDGQFGPVFCMKGYPEGPPDLQFALNRRVKMSSVKIYGLTGSPPTALRVLGIGGYELATTVTEETTSNGPCVTYTFAQPYEWDSLTLRFDNLQAEISMTEVEIYGKYESSVTNP